MGNPARWATFLFCGVAQLLAAPSMAFPAEAAGSGDAWIGWCAKADASATLHRSQLVFGPRGDRRWLTLGTGVAAQTCRARTLPLDIEHVVWFGPLPAMAGTFEQGVNLQGLAGPAKFEVSSIQSAEEAQSEEQPEQRPMPLAVDILPMLEVRPFGAEERAAVVRHADRAILTCRPGEKPAGFAFRHSERTVPVLPGLFIRIRALGDGRSWLFGFSDAERRQREDPLLIGALDGNVTELPVPGVSWDSAVFSAMTACPLSGGTLDVYGMELTARAPVRATDTAAWIWEPAAWREKTAEMFERLARHNARVVYVTIPTDDGPTGEGMVEREDALGDFIAVAKAKGVAVWAVIGDPHAVLPSERLRFEQLARIYAAYNAKSPPGRGLAGLQLDIEPYLLAGYSQDTQSWDAAYVETVNAIAKAAAELPVEVAVPVWYGAPMRKQRILDGLASEIHGVTVMDYRTDQRRIVEGALPFLTWGMEQGKKIRIAVEFGDLPNEETRFYRSSDTGKGELWRISLDGGDALILLDQPARNPAGASLAFVRSAMAPGKTQTFYGTKENISDSLRSLDAEMKLWPSYQGLAIHGIEHSPFVINR